MPLPACLRLRAVGGKSLETLEALNNDKATMEAQLSMQVGAHRHNVPSVRRICAVRGLVCLTARLLVLPPPLTYGRY